MITATPLSGLSGAREDIIGIMAVFMGKSKAERWMRDLESLIRKRAREGAEASIPRIRAQVEQAAGAGAKKAVKPMVIGAIAVGAFGALLGTAAYVRTRRRPR